MRKVVKTHLPNESAPIEWATKGGDYLYTAHVPSGRMVLSRPATSPRRQA
ncbi:hypothetical protein [Mesorhizobium sp. KR9-304]